MKAVYEEAGLELLLSEWGSLEVHPDRNRIPGRSLNAQPRLRRIANSVLGIFGFPIECAFDTIAIGKKR